jgi:hypothetical protein
VVGLVPKPQRRHGARPQDLSKNQLQRHASGDAKARGYRPASMEAEAAPKLTGLMKWSAPVLVEMAYTPELRKLYCEAVEMEEAV